MFPQHALHRVAAKLMEYLGANPPNTGSFKDTDEMANSLLSCLLVKPTYIFDYKNLQDKVTLEDAMPHVLYLAEAVIEEPINLMCDIDFPPDSPLTNLIFFTSQFAKKKPNHPAHFSHLTVPGINTQVVPSQTPDPPLTPRSLGLATAIYKDSEGDVNVSLCGLNQGLQDAYKKLGNQVDFVSLYQRTFLAMLYALNCMRCTKETFTTRLPADRTGNAPLATYHTVNILEQPVIEIENPSLH